MFTKKEKFSVDYTQLLRDVLLEEGTISSCYSMFHNYTLNNQFLAYHQMKMRGIKISPINSFSGWNKLNRSINKGEKAIYLWQPIVIKEKELNTKTNKIEEVEKVIFTFKPKWFALSQTNGAEIKPEDIKIGGFNFENVFKTFGIKLVDFDSLNGNVQGFARVKEKELAINPLDKHAEMTILHEVAHIVLKHSEVDYGRDMQELEAETVAYIVGSVLKLNDKMLSDSRGYVQNWFKGNEIPPKHANNIMRVADKILKAGLQK